MLQDLTDEQYKQVCMVHDASYSAVCEILGEDPESSDLEWDMYWIEDVANAIVNVMLNHFDIFGKTEQELYPYIKEE